MLRTLPRDILTQLLHYSGPTLGALAAIDKWHRREVERYYDKQYRERYNLENGFKAIQREHYVIIHRVMQENFLWCDQLLREALVYKRERLAEALYAFTAPTHGNKSKVHNRNLCEQAVKYKCFKFLQHLFCRLHIDSDMVHNMFTVAARCDPETIRTVDNMLQNDVSAREPIPCGNLVNVMYMKEIALVVQPIDEVYKAMTISQFEEFCQHFVVNGAEAFLGCLRSGNETLADYIWDDLDINSIVDDIYMSDILDHACEGGSLKWIQYALTHGVLRTAWTIFIKLLERYPNVAYEFYKSVPEHHAELTSLPYRHGREVCFRFFVDYKLKCDRMFLLAALYDDLPTLQAMFSTASQEEKEEAFADTIRTGSWSCYLWLFQELGEPLLHPEAYTAHYSLGSYKILQHARQHGLQIELCHLDLESCSEDTKVQMKYAKLAIELIDGLSEDKESHMAEIVENFVTHNDYEVIRYLLDNGFSYKANLIEKCIDEWCYHALYAIIKTARDFVDIFRFVGADEVNSEYLLYLMMQTDEKKYQRSRQLYLQSRPWRGIELKIYEESLLKVWSPQKL